MVFKDRKPDRYGVAVQATGTVPMYARRADGHVLSVSGTPSVGPMPRWLVSALGGRYSKGRA